jgi:hypothetical protein
MTVAKPELTQTISKVRSVNVRRMIATAWLSLWTAIGWTLGSVVYVLHLIIWGIGFALGWAFHAANYGFRNGAHIKTEPKKRPSVPA